MLPWWFWFLPGSIFLLIAAIPLIGKWLKTSRDGSSASSRRESGGEESR